MNGYERGTIKITFNIETKENSYMLTIHTYFKSLTVVTFCGTLFIPTLSLAASITNGDFNSGDFAGWLQDIDGSGSTASGLNDFSITHPTPGNAAARIEADYWATPGNTTSTAQDEAFFASTLYQSIDLSASINLKF